MMEFPEIGNHGKARISDGKVTFSYRDSYGSQKTETRALLSPEKIVSMVKGRMKRFYSQDERVRESDSSRRERKYIAAQPEEALRSAWELMDDMEKMEMCMMLDKRSHNGLSDPDWIKKHSSPTKKIEGDDGNPLNSMEYNKKSLAKLLMSR